MFAALVAAASFALPAPDVLAPNNLMAWCVVPFDAKKRGPAERAEMLQRLGFTKFAYDWRAEHLPTFDQEVQELKKRNIELTAVWFPATLNADAKALLAVIEKHKLTPQLWVMLPQQAGGDEAAKVAAAAKQVETVVEAAGKLGCKVSLYNHGGWAGDPEVMVAIVEAINRPHVGIVYNLHHGHDHLRRFPAELTRMLPHLHAVNLNGTHADGDRTGRKIDILGDGPEDLPLLRVIAASGYRGPVGVLGHTDDDAEARLADNLAGLTRLRAMLAGGPVPPRQAARTRSKEVRVTVSADRTSVTFGPSSEPVNLTASPWGGPGRLEGSAARDGDFIRYTPRFKLTANADYSVSIDRGTLIDEVKLTVPADRPPAVPTRVLGLGAMPDAVPENTLRLYLHFSRPMARGEGLKHVGLTAKDGTPVLDPFLDLAEELWSGDGRRLTLLFDPGRVKRELVPREELGPILTAGKAYRLTVNAAWPDEDGFPLGGAFTKDFTATKADEAPVDPAKWKVVPLAKRVTAAFEKPLDAALAGRMIAVFGPGGTTLAGEAVSDGKAWVFTAPHPLPAGDYLLRIDTRLEDPCGNRVGRAFEIDLREPGGTAAKSVDVKFMVK